jgi:hypothetical protein
LVSSFVFSVDTFFGIADVDLVIIVGVIGVTWFIAVGSTTVAAVSFGGIVKS